MWGKKPRSPELNANIAEELICGRDYGGVPQPGVRRRLPSVRADPMLAACGLTCFGGSRSRTCECPTAADCVQRGAGSFESAKRRDTFDDEPTKETDR